MIRKVRRFGLKRQDMWSWSLRALFVVAFLLILGEPSKLSAATLPDPCAERQFQLTLAVDAEDLFQLRKVRPNATPYKLASNSWDTCAMDVRAFLKPGYDYSGLSGRRCLLTFNVLRRHNRWESENLAQGQCDPLRVEIRMRDDIPSDLLKYWPKNADGDYDPTRHAEIAGHDVAHIEMWDNHYHLAYTFSGRWITSYSGQGHMTTNTFWGVAGGFYLTYCSYEGPNGCERAEGYNYVDFHSCGFPTCLSPDVDAHTRALARAYGTGTSVCSFWYDWDGAEWYPILHTHTQCYVQ